MRFPQFKQHDWFLTMAISMLLLIGLGVIYSATFQAKTAVEGAGTINRQLVFVILSFAVYFVVSKIDPKIYKYFPIKFLMYVVIVGLLLYVWIFGDPIRNTNRWIEWGFVRIQPSEYAKVVLILLNSGILADIFSKKAEEEIRWDKNSSRSLRIRIINFIVGFKTKYHTIYAYTLAVIISSVCIALTVVEPALGSAIIIALICTSLFVVTFPKQRLLIGAIIMCFLSINIAAQIVTFQPLYNLIGVDLVVNKIDIGMTILSIICMLLTVYFLRINLYTVLISIFVGIISLSSISYIWNNVLRDYQRRRIEIFFDPEQDPQGAGWQLRQAKIAIGSGRLFGKGFMQGSQSKLRYLPEAYSDFIFAAFCEEFGLIGALVLFSLYILLIVRVVAAAKIAHSPYEALVCIGVVMMIIIHIFINIGMNIGIIPVTGIPLPLISYGGSSIMVTMIALGLVQSVNMHRDFIDSEEGLMITSESHWKADNFSQ